MKYIIQMVMINMNKSDYKLIFITLLLGLSFILLLNLYNNDEDKWAYIYYQNELVKRIDLSIDENREYVIEGYNGDVVIESKNNMVRVKDEISPLNICSKQGWVSSSYAVIVCLPNQVIIEIETISNDLDTVVR